MDNTVYFRAFEEEDAPIIYKWMNDDDLKQLSIGLNRRMCHDEVLDWVKARMRHNPYQVWWAICAKDTDRLIGYMSLTDIHYINSSANFSGIMIGDSLYQDGFAWIESYLFLYEYAFERLGLNRVYGEALADHKVTRAMSMAMFAKTEGVLRQSVFKNGTFHDIVIASLMRNEYFEHKANGDYEIRKIIRRVAQIHKNV